MKYFMATKSKQYSQLFDDGVKSGVIAEIGEKTCMLLFALASFMNRDGVCYPSKKRLAKILGKSERAISQQVAIARRACYRGVPVLTTQQKKEKVRGKIQWSSNLYQISKPIMEDLITRFYSAGRKRPAEEGEEIRGKSGLPYTQIPSTENVPTNDNPSVNHISNNDKRESLINKSSFTKITLPKFEKSVNSNEQERCLYIAKLLEEPHMNFILKALNDKKCGMAGIEWAYGRIKEEIYKGTIRKKGRLFNYYIQQFKEGKTTK